MSHAIIDGVIDIPRTKGWVFEHEDAKLSPDAVSQTCVSVYGRKTDQCLDCGLVLVPAYPAADDVCI